MESVLQSLFLDEGNRVREVKEFAQSKQGSQDLSSGFLHPKLRHAPLSQGSAFPVSLAEPQAGRLVPNDLITGRDKDNRFRDTTCVQGPALLRAWKVAETNMC